MHFRKREKVSPKLLFTTHSNVKLIDRILRLHPGILAYKSSFQTSVPRAASKDDKICNNRKAQNNNESSKKYKVGRL